MWSSEDFKKTKLFFSSLKEKKNQIFETQEKYNFYC